MKEAITFVKAIKLTISQHTSNLPVKVKFVKSSYFEDHLKRKVLMKRK